jgi:hypothetical protein
LKLDSSPANHSPDLTLLCGFGSASEILGKERAEGCDALVGLTACGTFGIGNPEKRALGDAAAGVLGSANGRLSVCYNSVITNTILALTAFVNGQKTYVRKIFNK